jgi:hypothetical protein
MASCQECTSCTSYLHGSHPDIIESDAASKTGVDSIKHLKEMLFISPYFQNRRFTLLTRFTGNNATGQGSTPQATYRLTHAHSKKLLRMRIQRSKWQPPCAGNETNHRSWPMTKHTLKHLLLYRIIIFSVPALLSARSVSLCFLDLSEPFWIFLNVFGSVCVLFLYPLSPSRRVQLS